MSYDDLVNQAEEKGGYASMAVRPKSSFQVENNSLPSLQSSFFVSQASHITPFFQPVSYQVNAPIDPLREVEQANRHYNAAKEFKKNAEEQERKNRICMKQWSLSCAQINPIENILLDRFIPFTVPLSIANTAYHISNLTGLNSLGIIYAILGAVSIATWGRISIKLNDTWSEPAVDMLIQASSAGTKNRRWQNIYVLHSIFIVHKQMKCSMNVQKKPKKKKRLVTKISDSRSRKKIEAALKESALMEQEDELALLQQTIAETAQFNCHLAQSVEIPPGFNCW